MGTSPMELKWLLMWLLFGFIKGNRPGVCPHLPPPEFADVTADMYPPQTKLYYECDPGYGRRASAYLGIQCKIEQQGAVWKYQPFKCFDMKNLSSMMDLELTQKPETEQMSTAPQKQEDLSESKPKDFCGPPKTIPHASIRLPQQHYVGQVLHFKCQTGYEKRLPTFGSRMCKEVDGKTFWTHLDMRCTNDSNQQPPQTIEPGLSLLSSFPSSSGTLPVTGFTAIWFVLLIIPTAFV
ncbi:interleukin-2 receptor subunit alpha-like isoform X1 [Haemorhous mexicanus]|uniref:interleukin-2 receptor subunit alpha-like isoform X1 n=2 Tax=Haemorhous mexicanus TaxID=30427 RepID=UPI0028BD8DE3|nr:interleukin-2 receptor subunit alpha-like isoform X1 [Haemorhous mexicanus]XP_059703542.1 interleukin-2 receptor subunit alpha-like isoform X1 [Haemorhous mexicanus]